MLITFQFGNAHAVLCGYETWTVTVAEGHGFRKFEKGASEQRA